MHCHSALSLVSVAAALLLAPAGVAAQAAPPIPGVTGTLATEGTVEKEYAGAHAVLVKTIDGIEHLFHWTERTELHGDANPEAVFSGLTPGSRVVVHYVVEDGAKTAVEVDRISDGGLREMQGVISRVDRRTKRLSIHLADGSNQILQLSDHAADDSGNDLGDGATVVVYYVGEDGNKVAHYFRRIRED